VGHTVWGFVWSAMADVRVGIGISVYEGFGGFW
jgi:hypothetical protein